MYLLQAFIYFYFEGFPTDTDSVDNFVQHMVTYKDVQHDCLVPYIGVCLGAVDDPILVSYHITCTDLKSHVKDVSKVGQILFNKFCHLHRRIIFYNFFECLHLRFTYYHEIHKKMKLKTFHAALKFFSIIVLGELSPLQIFSNSTCNDKSS